MGATDRNGGIIPVVMAGGAGSRLWPLSRDSYPKQFIALFEGGLSTFQATLKRVAGPRFSRPIVVTHHDFRFLVAEQMLAAGIEGDIVLEPERRDSAPAVAVGTVLARARHPDALCLVLAADHAIGDDGAFVEDCVKAARLAADGRIMTIGIPPTHASTAYGYLAIGERLEDSAWLLERFVEKPDTEKAAAYVKQGYLWNSGNFIFSAETMAQELAHHAPAVLSAAEGAVSAATRDLDFLRLDATAFAKATKISIDYAVMEKTDKAGCVAAHFSWSDIGSWDSLRDIRPRDADGNVLEGPVELVETRNSLVRSDGALTTVIGLDGVIVVTTPDAVLVAAQDQSAKVKTLVEKMKAAGRSEASEHLRMYRPWGWYQRIDIGPRFQVKRISVKPGGRLSLQKHFHRSEHWIVVRGTAEVTLDGAVSQVHENESVYLPIGSVHRLANPGRIDLELIEVQVGSYTGEDDIVRFEDVYARD